MTRPAARLASFVTAVAVLAACGGASPGSPASTSAGAPASSATSPAPSSVATAAPTPSPRYAPQPRSSAAMTWDPTSKSVVLFGGDTSGGPTNAFDAWDGASWSSLGRIGPPARDDARLVADRERGVIVLSGGRNGPRILNDTWEWDGTAWTEKQVSGPTPRAHAASAYDPVSKRVLVYGGVGETDTLRDTWAWDGTSWTQLDSKGIPGLIPNGMAWDPVRQQLLVLAVDLEPPSETQLYPSELWGWTGSGWERVAGDGPAFSPLQQLVEGPQHPWLVDGGVVQGTVATYEWDGTTWLARGGAGPAVRNGQAAAFDHERQQLVMFGGFNDSLVFGDTWLLAGGEWREVRS